MYNAPLFLPLDAKHIYLLQTGYLDHSFRVTSITNTSKSSASLLSKTESSVIVYQNTNIVTCADIDCDNDFCMTLSFPLISPSNTSGWIRLLCCVG